MVQRDDLFSIFHSPIGRHAKNEADDILRAKQKFSALGYYNTKIENGYIDRPLVQAITQYQKDRGLAVDGRINPGGQTEATIFSDFLGLPDQGDSDIKLAAGPAVPALFSLPAIARGASTARKAWDIWRAMPHHSRQEALDAECDKKYHAETKECSGRKTGKERAVCYAEASERYAACLRGRVDSDLPPLQGR